MTVLFLRKPLKQRPKGRVQVLILRKEAEAKEETRAAEVGRKVEAEVVVRGDTRTLQVTVLRGLFVKNILNLDVNI